jgi:tetratricopeptide (TPR) repeat protein
MRLIIRSCLLLLAALFSLIGYGQTNSRDMQKESAIWDQLRAVAPDLVATFKQGTEKMDAGDFTTAASLYQKVLDAAPAFDPAIRRLGSCLYEAGDTDHGIAQLERAVQLHRSPENLSTLAQFLAFPGQNKPATREAQQRAMDLIQEATRKSPQPQASDLFTTARIAIQLENEKEFRQATRQMVEKFPDLAGSHYLNAIRAKMDE